MCVLRGFDTYQYLMKLTNIQAHLGERFPTIILIKKGSIIEFLTILLPTPLLARQPVLLAILNTGCSSMEMNP